MKSVLQLCEIIDKLYTHMILSEYECHVSLAHSQNKDVGWTASTKHRPSYFNHSKQATPASSYSLHSKSLNQTKLLGSLSLPKPSQPYSFLSTT